MSDLEIIKKSHKESILPCNDPESATEWARFGFFVGIKFLREIRLRRFSIPSFVQNEKEDGSPATLFEEILEMVAIESLNEFYSLAGYIGEESGDLTKNNEDIVMLLDPIDGTRSFLSGFDTYSVTLSILKNKKPIFSLICLPATADIVYRIDDSSSKLFQYHDDTDKIKLYKLPLLKKSKSILVNVHAAMGSFNYLESLYKMWESGIVSLIRSSSGSPSLMFLEVAKGSCVYLNGWGQGKTYPFDIIPGLHILQGAGGYILNSEGESVDPWNHSGLFLAGLNKEKLKEIIKML